MAAKKPAARKVSDKQVVSDLRKLTKKARDELARLLAQEQAGTITRKNLHTGLEEVEEKLQRIFMFQHRL